MKYKVNMPIINTASVTFEVEADNEYAAIETAKDRWFHSPKEEIGNADIWWGWRVDGDFGIEVNEMEDDNAVQG
jgi:hypothetical protein